MTGRGSLSLCFQPGILLQEGFLIIPYLAVRLKSKVFKIYGLQHETKIHVNQSIPVQLFKSGEAI
jgi:hypothetical protein